MPSPIVTKEQLQKIMPHLHADQAIIYEPIFQAMLAKYNMTSPLRKSAFIANVAHETGELQYLRELWGPTPQQILYERDPGQKWGEGLTLKDRNYLAFNLGNSEVGDGKLFRGRGGFQYTGRKNYFILSKKMGVDLIKTPGLLEQSAIAIESAAIYWMDNHLVEYADLDKLDPIADVINRGHVTKAQGDSNGWDQRLFYYNKAKQVFA